MPGLMGGAVGFITAGGLAGGAGLLMSLSPALSGQRKPFLLRTVPMLVLKGGSAFGAILFVGAYLRCL